MSSNGNGTDEEIPGREVAYRVFAAEYDDADLSYAESDEERAPNYVITPTGARLNRLFAVGTLTEVTSVNDEMVRARVVDPTGAFVVYAGQYQPDALATLEQLTPPAFVAVTGKARTFQPDDADRVYTSVRPESIAAVDADTRDRWVITTAERTFDRIGTYATAMELDASGAALTRLLEDHGVEDGLAAGIPIAMDHYETTPDYLARLRDCTREAVAVIAGDREQVSPFDLDPSDTTPDSETSGADFTTLAEVDLPEHTDSEADQETAIDAGAKEPATADRTAETAIDAADTDEAEPAGTDDIGTGTAAGTASLRADDDETTSTEPNATVDAADRSVSDGEPASGGESTAGTDDLGDFDDGAETAAAESSEDSALTAESADDGGSDEAPGSADDSDDDLGDFDAEGMYQMDDEEREQIESEFGTEFTTGTDVDDPGESDIDVPSADEHTPAADETETDTVADSDETTTSDEPDADAERAGVDEADTASTDETADADEAADTADEDVDLEAYVIETMTELDDGTGADRVTLTETVAEETGADEAEIDDAIQDALMGGQCYEPDDETLKPI